MKFKSLFLFLLISLCGISQIPQHKFIEYANETSIYDSAYYVAYKIKMFEKYKALFADNPWLDHYIKMLVDDKKSTGAGGELYTNWPEANEYLNKLVKLFLKDKWVPENTVVITRDQTINAYMKEDGKIYMHVGMLANAFNEAELAGIIGHECGHFVKQHNYKSFIKYKESFGKRRIFSFYGEQIVDPSRRTVEKYFALSRKQEEEADLIAIDLLKASAFRMNALFLKKLLKEEKKSKMEKEYRTHSYFHTHPPSEERIKVAETEAKKTDTIGRRDFVVDKTMFYKIKQQAIDECIFLNMYDLNFHEVIEICYRQLLLNPNDEFYLFFLNEALRRFLYMYPEKENAFFITDKYKLYSNFTAKKDQPKFINSAVLKTTGSELGNHINYNQSLLFFNDELLELKNLPANSLTNNDTLEFVTYKEALDYFIARQEKLGQSSVNFVKKMSGRTISPLNINSIYKDLNAYSSLEINAPADISEVYTIIPLKINYKDRTVSFWGLNTGSNVDESTFFSDVLKSLEKDVKPPYKMIDFRQFSTFDKVKLYDQLNSLQRFGLTVKELETYYKENSKRLFNYDVYKFKPCRISLVNPEMVGFFREHHLNKVIFINMEVTEYVNGSVSMGGIPVGLFTGANNISTFSGYYFDIDKKQFAHKFYCKMSRKTNDLIYSTAHELVIFSKQIKGDIEMERESTIIKK